MQNTGDSAAWLALSADCSECARVADSVTGYFRAGGYIKTNGERIQEAQRVKGMKGRAGRAYVIDTVADPVKFKRSAGQKEESLPGGKERYIVFLARAGSSWQVTDFSRFSG